MSDVEVIILEDVGTEIVSLSDPEVEIITAFEDTNIPFVVQARTDSEAAAVQTASDLVDVQQIKTDCEAIQTVVLSADTNFQAIEDNIEAIEVNVTSIQTDVTTKQAEVTADLATIQTLESNASTSAGNALASELKAQKWSEENEDVQVELGEYSAKHHALKSAASAASALANKNITDSNVVLTNQDVIDAGNSATAAAGSASSASTSETNAGISESNAATSATNAATSETNASSSASAASLSESNAATSETNASNSASSAASSASNASTSESNAASSASAASLSETNAAASETNAGLSETNAGNSATAAAGSASAASTSETNAAASESNAATSASNASTSESNAAASASSASTSANNASTSESNALTHANNAATSESNAAASAATAQSAASSLTNGLYHAGSWDASGGSAPSNPTGDGYPFYKITIAGTINTVQYGVGDNIVWDGSGWYKVDNTEAVTSVNGQQGVVTLVKSDVGLDNVDNTSDANKPISTAVQSALDAKVDDSQVLTDVPAGAVFTDTVYSHPTFTANSIDLSGSTVLSAINTNSQGHVTGITTRTLTPANIGALGVSAKAADSELLDGINSYQFLRSDVDNTFSGGKLTINNTSGDTISPAGAKTGLEVRQDTAAADAFMTFHVGGDYASYFGLRGSDNSLVWGGWSEGSTGKKIYHEGNKPTPAEIGALGVSAKAADSELLDGINSSSFLRSDADDTFTYLSGTKLGCDNLEIENGKHTINNNDGTGNFNIKVGTAHGSSVCTETGYGSHWVFNQGTGQWSFNTSTSSTTEGATHSWTTALSLDKSGNATFAGNVTAYSDERIKTNWRDLQDSFVDQLAEVKHGIYDRTDIEMTQVGVSAQSLQKVMPEAVSTNDEGKLSVSYGNAALTACVELAKEVVQLKKRINELEGK